VSAGVLHLITGKIAAGKSTLSAKLAVETGGLVLAEDHWLPTLYPAQITSLTNVQNFCVWPGDGLTAKPCHKL